MLQYGIPGALEQRREAGHGVGQVGILVDHHHETALARQLRQGQQRAVPVGKGALRLAERSRQLLPEFVQQHLARQARREEVQVRLLAAPLVDQAALAHAPAAVEDGEFRPRPRIAAFQVAQLTLAIAKHRSSSQTVSY